MSKAAHVHRCLVKMQEVRVTERWRVQKDEGNSNKIMQLFMDQQCAHSESMK